MSFALGCTGLFFAVFFLGTSAPFFKGFEMICFFPTLLYKVMFLQGIFFSWISSVVKVFVATFSPLKKSPSLEVPEFSQVFSGGALQQSHFRHVTQLVVAKQERGATSFMELGWGVCQITFHSG